MFFAAATLLWLAGCGQNGPLFLPEDAPPATEAASDANAPPAETTGAAASDPAVKESNADDEER